MTESSLTIHTEPGPVEPGGPPDQKREVSRSLWADGWRELRSKPLFWASLAIVLAMTSMALFPSLWSSANPEAAGFCKLGRAQQGPSAAHPFGFTFQGCDMWASVVYGTSKSLAVALIATVGTTAFGMFAGTLAGFYPGLTDTVLSRIADIFFGIPWLLGTFVFLAVMPIRNIWTISAALIILQWPTFARVMRGSVLTTKNKDFVEAARGLGASNGKIIRRHIIPNSTAPIVVLATIYLGVFVGTEATLTYLGVGFQRPDTTWGLLIAEGQVYALQGSPHLLLVPCGLLVLTVLAFIMLGDMLRDAFDPRGR
jgi:ABC-type dipeptide/oligopeptide/nickel transport system permease subunit